MSTPSNPSRTRSAGGPANGRHTPAHLAAAVLLLAPFVALLWVSSYAKDEPRLWGFPFFYWYQFLWVFLASLFTYTAYRIVRRVERASASHSEASADREAARLPERSER